MTENPPSTEHPPRTENPPDHCRACGEGLAYHGGHGGPIRRNGWFRYKCDSRWHPDHGWSTGREGCASKRYEKALTKIATAPPRTIKAIQDFARQALDSSWSIKPTR